MVKYNIVNKIYLQGKKVNRLLRILLGFMAGLLLLLGLIQIIVGKLSFTVVLQSVLLPLILANIGRKNLHGGHYMSAALELTLEPGKLLMHYPAIDREDGDGIREEVIQILAEDIADIRYSEELKSVRMLAKAETAVRYERTEAGRQQSDRQEKDQPEEFILYLPYEEKDRILTDLQKYLKCKILYID